MGIIGLISEGRVGGSKNHTLKFKYVMQYRENFCNASPFKDHAFNVNKISLLACMISKYSKYTTF